jgi:hypothetical protein
LFLCCTPADTSFRLQRCCFCCSCTSTSTVGLASHRFLELRPELIARHLCPRVAVHPPLLLPAGIVMYVAVLAPLLSITDRIRAEMALEQDASWRYYWLVSGALAWTLGLLIYPLCAADRLADLYSFRIPAASELTIWNVMWRVLMNDVAVRYMLIGTQAFVFGCSWECCGAAGSAVTHTRFKVCAARCTLWWLLAVCLSVCLSVYLSYGRADVAGCRCVSPVQKRLCAVFATLSIIVRCAATTLLWASFYQACSTQSYYSGGLGEFALFYISLKVSVRKRLCCCAVLCCAVLCCAVLCCAVLCCAVLCCAVLCCAAARCASSHLLVWFCCPVCRFWRSLCTPQCCSSNARCSSAASWCARFVWPFRWHRSHRCRWCAVVSSQRVRRTAACFLRPSHNN